MINQESPNRRVFPVTTSPLQQSVGITNTKDRRNISITTEALLIEEVKHCIMCKSALREQESTYLVWQGMYFCDIICLHWYQKENLVNNCSNCSCKISSDSIGKFVFRFDQLLQFCSIPCFHEYHVNRKSCLYCKGKIVTPSAVRVSQRNPLYCSQECYIKHNKCRGTTTILPDLDKDCTICHSALYPMAFHFQSGEGIKSACSLFCLQIYACSSRILLCVSCKMYFTSNILTPIEATCKGYVLCSKKCKTYFIFSNSKVYSCGYCEIKRFSIDLIKRCSKIEPPVYLCSIECYLKRYCVVHSSFSVQQLLSFGLNKIPSVNKLSAPQATKKYPRKLFVLPPIIEENLMESNSETKPLVVAPHRVAEQKNVTTMCSIQKSDKGTSVAPETLEKGSQTDFSSLEKAIYPASSPNPVPQSLPTLNLIFLPYLKESFNNIFEDIENIVHQSASSMVKANVLAIEGAVNEGDLEELQNHLIPNKSAADATISDDMRDNEVKILEINENIMQGLQGTLTDTESDENSIQVFQGSNNTELETVNALDMRIGIHAWRRWLKLTENGDVDILNLSSSRLAGLLSLFVNEVRRPNGKSYAPDTIFYLCLSLQCYLLKHGRNDNIFFDCEYKEFAKCLDEQMKLFPFLFFNSPYIETRVEEEHLWECAQLGASSPYVLLNTILYNNMKYFHLTTIEENMSLLRFNVDKSVIEKKGESGESQTVLRFFPNKEFKYFCEMTSNSLNPERCPINLFELYCSKLPILETNKFDHLYFKPKPSCSTDSPVWYSTETIDKSFLEIMMNRLMVVKELNVLSNEGYLEE